MNSILEKQIQNDTLSHAILLLQRNEGVVFSEVEELAIKLFQKKANINKQEIIKNKIKKRTHPDFIIVEGEKKLISIQNIRDMQKELVSAPLEGDIRLIYIKSAHNMGKEAQNALLKTLEEPKPYVYIILSADRLESMLPTIRSRCQIIEYTDYVEKKDSKELMIILNKILSGDKWATFQAVEYMESKKEEIEIYMELLIEILRDIYIYKLTKNKNILKNSENIDIIEFEKQNKNINYVEIIDEIIKVSEGLKRNVNLKLSMEHIFLKIMEESI